MDCVGLLHHEEELGTGGGLLGGSHFVSPYVLIVAGRKEKTTFYQGKPSSLQIVCGAATSYPFASRSYERGHGACPDAFHLPSGR